MRQPTVENKYDLTMAKIRKLKITDRSQIGKPLFWRNDVIGAWCIVGKLRVHLTSYGGMCGYKFNQFFREKDIENDNDLLIQEKFLSKINELIDLGILSQE